MHMFPENNRCFNIVLQLFINEKLHESDQAWRANSDLISQVSDDISRYFDDILVTFKTINNMSLNCITNEKHDKLFIYEHCNIMSSDIILDP